MKRNNREGTKRYRNKIERKLKHKEKKNIAV